MVTVLLFRVGSSAVVKVVVFRVGSFAVWWCSEWVVLLCGKGGGVQSR